MKDKKLIDVNELLEAIEKERAMLAEKAKFYNDPEYSINLNDCIRIINSMERK